MRVAPVEQLLLKHRTRPPSPSQPPLSALAFVSCRRPHTGSPLQRRGHGPGHAWSRAAKEPRASRSSCQAGPPRACESPSSPSPGSSRLPAHLFPLLLRGQLVRLAKGSLPRRALVPPGHPSAPRRHAKGAPSPSPPRTALAHRLTRSRPSRSLSTIDQTPCAQMDEVSTLPVRPSRPLSAVAPADPLLPQGPTRRSSRRTSRSSLGPSSPSMPTTRQSSATRTCLRSTRGAPPSLGPSL